MRARMGGAQAHVPCTSLPHAWKSQGACICFTATLRAEICTPSQEVENDSGLKMEECQHVLGMLAAAVLFYGITLLTTSSKPKKD